MKTTVKADKADYEIHAYIGGYYGICRDGSHGASPIYGGDSACPDHYDEELIQYIYDQWDGTLSDIGGGTLGIEA